MGGGRAPQTPQGSSLSRASSLNRGCEPFYLSPKLFNLKCFVRLGSGTVHERELFYSLRTHTSSPDAISHLPLRQKSSEGGYGSRPVKSIYKRNGSPRSVP